MERRRSERKTGHWPVIIHFESATTRNGIVSDIGDEGAFIVTSDSVHPSGELTLKILHPLCTHLDDDVCEVEGYVVHTNPRGFGVKFRNVSEIVRGHIATL